MTPRRRRPASPFIEAPFVPLSDEQLLERDFGPVTDGIPYGEYGNLHVQPLIALKDDDCGGPDECAMCTEAAVDSSDGWMCFASLGEVSEEDLDRWVKYGPWQFSDEMGTFEGGRRWNEYYQADRARYEAEGGD